MAVSPTVSVVIPAFNAADYVDRALRALQDQTFPRDRYQVIVVDNGSTDGTRGIAGSFPDVVVVEEPSGWSYAARNAGIDASRGDIVAFTDADCIPEPDWLQQGVSCYQRTPRCGLVGGAVWPVFDASHAPGAIAIYSSLVSFDQQHFIERSGFAATANLFTSRAVINAVGRFDPALRSGGDFDWGQRVAAAGFRLVFCPEAIVRHPARSRLTDEIRRSLRVFAGPRRRRRDGIMAGLRHLVIESPRELMRRHRERYPEHSLWMRLKVVGFLFLLRACKLIEAVRLALGARPRR